MPKNVSASDLEDRDPNILSHRIQVSWEDVIGEPEGVRSPECSWRLSRYCFDYSRQGCYIFLSVLCSPIAACFMGCFFACQAFEQIWCFNPCLKMFKVAFRGVKIFMMIFTEAIVAPLCAGASTLWSGIKVRTKILPEGPDVKEGALLDI